MDFTRESVDDTYTGIIQDPVRKPPSRPPPDAAPPSYQIPGPPAEKPKEEAPKEEAPKEEAPKKLPPDIKIELSKADLPMSYGAYGRPLYDNMTLLGALPEKYVPTSSNKRRLIVIGDVHGMISPLDTLLKEAGYDKSKDHVISVGDMVNKGPDSAAVVSRLMEIGASAVRGNHEDRVLLAWAAQNARTGVEADLASADAEVHRGESDDLKTARSLKAEQLAWLQALPVILTIDPLSVYVVHAGLVPGIELQQQDPWACMNMRTMRYPRAEFRKKEEERKKKDEEKKKQEAEKKKKEEEEKKKKEEEEKKKKEEEEKKKKEEEEKKKQQEEEQKKQEVEAVQNARRSEDEVDAPSILVQQVVPDQDVWLPTDAHDGDQWASIWNREQRRIEHSLRRTVIYGHDAKRGYQQDLYTFGLDSNCVKGGVLTAFIIESDGEGGWKHTTTQVPCGDLVG